MLALLLICAQSTPPVVVVPSEMEDVEAEDRTALLESVQRSIEEASGRRAVIDLFAASVDDVLSRTGGDVAVLVSMVGGSKLVRITIEKRTADGVSKRLTLDAPRDRTSWIPMLTGTARALFPVPKPEPPPPPPPQVTASPPPSYGPTIAWVSLGGAVLVAGGATALRVIANRAGDEAETHGDAGQADAAHEDSDRSESLGLASNLLFGFAGAVATGAVVYLVSQ